MKSLKIKHIQLYLTVLFVGFLVSCNEAFLEPKPLSTFVPENTYTNKTAMVALLNECRHGLKWEYNDHIWKIVTEYVTSDLCAYGSSTASSFRNLDLQMTPNLVSNVFIIGKGDSYFDFGYQMIKSANIVISRHDQAIYENESDKNEILSEGYFHRAYWYYRLVHQYGDIPYIDGEIAGPTLDLYTSSRRSILNRMVMDMEFAVQHLPKSVQFGEVSRAAGFHLLTKLYLAVGRFEDAVRSASEVIEKSGLALMKARFGTQINPIFTGKDGIERVYQGNVLWDLFQKQNISISQNTESILVAQDRMEFRSNGSTGAASQKVRSWAPNVWAIPGLLREGPLWEYLLRGAAWARPAQYQTYTLWENSGNDLRHTWPNWFPMDSLYFNDPTKSNFGQPVPKPTVAQDSFNRWYPFQQYKIFVPDDRVDPKTSIDARGGWTDYYIFRLAETYLLRAEAHWWMGNLEEAKNDINEIRGRADAPLITAGDVTIDYILDERARELYTEEPRKCELTRISFIMADLGREGYNTQNMHTNNFFYDRVMRRNEFYGQQAQMQGTVFKMSPFHYLWPIPQRVIEANVEGHINQNMGYAGSENNIPPLE